MWSGDLASESEYGQRIRELENTVTVLKEQLKRAAEIIAESREDVKELRDDAKATKGAAFATLTGILLWFGEQIVVHGGFK